MNLSTPIPDAFTTDRLLVRRYRNNDEQALFDAARSSISEVFEFLPWCHPDYSIDDSRSWLRLVDENWTSGNTYNFCIWNRDETEFLGGCGITRLDEHPVGNLGYWIRSSATGQGIATEATIGLACFGFEHAGFQRIEIIMSVHNAASRGVAVASGATFEGTMRNRLLLHGKRHDAYLYSLVPEDLGL